MSVTEPRGAERPDVEGHRRFWAECGERSNFLVYGRLEMPRLLDYVDLLESRSESLAAEVARLESLAKAAVAWVDELQTWAEDVSETDQALIDAVDNYRVPLAALGTKGAS